MVADGAVQLIVSTAHAKRITTAEAWIVDNVDETPVRIIAPTQRAADDLARRAAHGRSGLLGVERTTIHRLATLWAAPILAEAGRTRLTGLAGEAMAVRAIHRATADRPFEYFHPVEHFDGFARAVARTLDDLRLAELPPAALSETPRERDIARLLVAFDDELTRLGLADRAVVLRAAIEGAARACARSEPFATLFIDVTPTDRLERRWVREIIDRSAKVLVLHAERDPEIVDNRPDTLRRELGVSADPRPPRTGGRAARLAYRARPRRRSPHRRRGCADAPLNADQHPDAAERRSGRGGSSGPVRAGARSYGGS